MTIIESLQEDVGMPVCKRGRPKGSKNHSQKHQKRRDSKGPGEKQVQRSINARPDDWEKFKAKAEAAGLSAAALLGRLIEHETIGAPIDPATLPRTAQQKLEAGRRMMEHKLSVEHAARVRGLDEEVRRQVLARGKQYLENLNRMQAKAEDTEQWYRKLINEHKPLFTSDEFKAVLMCLHPDGERTEAKLHEAFLLFNARKPQLCGEK